MGAVSSNTHPSAAVSEQAASRGRALWILVRFMKKLRVWGEVRMGRKQARLDLQRRLFSRLLRTGGWKLDKRVLNKKIEAMVLLTYSLVKFIEIINKWKGKPEGRWGSFSSSLLVVAVRMVEVTVHRGLYLTPLWVLRGAMQSETQRDSLICFALSLQGLPFLSHPLHITSPAPHTPRSLMLWIARVPYTPHPCQQGAGWVSRVLAML